MKLSHPIDISFRELVLKGKFDFVEPGQTKEWLEQNFADPDSKSDMGHGFFIWLYGNLEFHFEGDRLFMLWCDYLDDINLGEAIRFDKWILENAAAQSASAVFNLLIGEGADLQVRRQSPTTLLLHVNRSGVTLWFEADDDKPGEPKDYRLRAFSLTHADYETRFKR